MSEMDLHCTDGDSMTHALCGDCLRFFRFEQLVPDDDDPPGRCPACGGQTCHCEGCMRTAQLLADRDFLNPDAGLRAPDKIASWTPDGGAVFK